MNHNWQAKKLGEVCEIKPPKKEARDRLSDDDLVSFVPMEDLGILTKDLVATKERPLKEVSGSYTYFADNDVLLAKITPCFENGKIGIARNLKNGIGFGSSEYIVFRARGEVIPDYLYYFLAREQFRQDGKKVMTGAVGHKRVPKDFIESQIIPYPKSIHDQQRIVTILDEAFAAIATAKENAEKNLQNARELFESYLQSVFANPGDGWKEKTLDQVSITFGRGKSKHRPRNEKTLYGGKYPFIQTGDIRNSNHYITEYSQTYSEIGLAQSKLWPKGTICITIAANIAETGILGFDACFPDSVIGLVVNPKIAEMNFVEYLLQSFKARLQEKGKGSAQDNLNMGTFENELFPIPPLPEQRSIVAKLDALSAETQKLEAIYWQKLADLDELKKSVLEKAFSGGL